MKLFGQSTASPVQFFYTRGQKDKRSDIFLSKFVWDAALPALVDDWGKLALIKGNHLLSAIA